MYCGAHTDQVEDYVSRSKWSMETRSCPFSVLQFVRLTDARSIGDVLRDLDKRSLVDGDFLLVHGDLVSNLILDEALAAHRKRRENSAANIMTLILTSGGEAQHRTKTNGISPVFAIDSNTGRCLHYDEMNPLQSDHYFVLDPAIPDELSTDFELRSDLIDAQIDICTPEVLALWSESFDYELPRKHYLHGVLKDWELNGKMIYADVLEPGYAARASNLQMYDAISKDIIGRWTFPFIPENNLMARQRYSRHGHGVVSESGASHAMSASVTHSIMGMNSTIGERSRVTNSIIGRHCQIGADVVLDGCYIWQDATVEDGANISQSIIADSAIIGKNVSLKAGSLVSFGVQIGDGISLSNNISLTTVTDEGESVVKDTKLLGEKTNAALYQNPEFEDIDAQDPSRLQQSMIYSLAGFNLSSSSISTLNTAASSDDGNGGYSADQVSTSRSRLSSFASDDSGGKTSFHADAAHGLLDALRSESGDFDSAKLEFMGLRLANDASDTMMRKAIATAFARRTAELLTSEHGSLEPAKAAEKTFAAQPGAAKFVDEVGIGGGEPEQIEYALATQRALQGIRTSDQSRLGTLLAAIFQQLYASDILEEEGILGWWNDLRSQEGESMKTLRAKCKILVDWLENAEEEDDEDDEDDEDEDEDEDDDDDDSDT